MKANYRCYQSQKQEDVRERAEKLDEEKRERV
jgi:hypothetical protein